MDKIKKLLTTDEAAIYLGVTVQTLANWRHDRKYLKYVKLGRAIRYQKAELDRYIAENTISIS
ncbi:helix-turn-helix domain-containing protein [Desulfamplus magnetovallimortis]|uniref:helix-turn-helix domain-containing protein n=1 Tax=Desulfamplus magnetovallimortis TaxID=1246637 RepID=UPI001C95DF90|nr:helix-turn-helix domain-containing protein [Desulfamplus magnetovallimortis]